VKNEQKKGVHMHASRGLLALFFYKWGWGLMWQYRLPEYP
jgi:hypothetical protein